MGDFIHAVMFPCRACALWLSSRLPSHEMHALHLHACTCTCTHATLARCHGQQVSLHDVEGCRSVWWGPKSCAVVWKQFLPSCNSCCSCAGMCSDDANGTYWLGMACCMENGTQDRHQHGKKSMRAHDLWSACVHTETNGPTGPASAWR